jgi:FkbM family methyltransferase
MADRIICKSEDNYTYICYANDTISNSLSAYGYWENNLIQYSEKYLNDNSIILDIGANIGTWSIPLATKNRKIYSFEPFDSSFYALCGNIFINNKESIIYPRHCALTDNVNRKTSMLLSESVNVGGCKLIESETSVQTNKYALETLDSFKFDKIDLIKIDVEGHELNVLKGGEETIRKSKPVILFECWDNESPHWAGIPNTSIELMNYIKSLGYEINKIYIDGNDNYEAIPFSKDI